jgi:hypothetical protein
MLEVRFGEFTVIFVNKTRLLVGWSWLGWRVLLGNAGLWLQITQIKLLFVLVLDHAVEPHEFVVQGRQLLGSLAIVESRNSRDPEIK